MGFRLHLMQVGDSSIRDYILYLNEHGRPAQLLLLSLLLPLLYTGRLTRTASHRSQLVQRFPNIF